MATGFVFAQSINTEFGKNRVQYHDDFNDWWMYETENFITYWYGKSKQIAIPTMQLAEADHDMIQKVLEHRMNDKIEILVYTDLSDLKQSNIGTEETFASKGGETKIVGNKLFVFFNGVHSDLRKRIREGIAQVYFSNMLFGNNFQEILQNAVLLNLPEWYKEGVVAFAHSPWDKEVESQLREVWSEKPKWHSFDKLAEKYPRLAGHSMWYFIDQTYGRSNISNIIYLTKISRGINNSFEYILNNDVKTLKNEWKDFFTDYFNNERQLNFRDIDDKRLKFKNPKESVISQIKSSPDGKYFSYVHNRQGRYRIVLFDREKQTSKTIFKYGYRNPFQETDFNYPLIAWNFNAQELSYIYEHKDVIKIVKYNITNHSKAEQIIPTAFQRIYSFDYINDFDFIMSANVDGFSNLYYYKSKNRNHGYISEDYFDYQDVTYTKYKGEKGILYAGNSTRDSIQRLLLDTIIPVRKMDIFFLKDGSLVAERITNTTDISERKPIIVDQEIYFLSDHNGINNLYGYNINTKSTYAITNSPVDIDDFTINDDKTAVVTTYKNRKHLVALIDLVPLEEFPKSTVTGIQTEGPIFLIPKVEEPLNTWSDGYMFQSLYDDPQTHQPLSKTKKEDNIDREVAKYTLKNTEDLYKPPVNIEPYNMSRSIAANLRFGIHNIVTKMDNDILFEGLESYIGDRPEVLNTPLGFLFKTNIKDLFEDYSLDAGIRIPTAFNGTETFLVFDDKKFRLDKRYAIYRKSNEYTTSDATSVFLTKSKKTSLLGMYQIKLPVDIYRSIRATSQLRFDRFLELSTENNSFSAPAITEKRISVKIEYIYDNTFDANINIKHGLRYKIFNEAINEFDINFIDGFKFNLSNGFTNVIGFDARYYLPVLKKSVLAFRGAGATSIGNKKILYYLGGVQNNILSKFDRTIPLPDDDDYSYKVNAYHLRGFDSNIRNGSTFLVYNSEFRLPLFQYLLGPNRGGSFIRNMQLTGFFDAGLAFFGRSPFSEKNKLNQVVIKSPPLIELNVEYFRDPLVMGMGYGLRTQILGYFIKVDYAYGIETRVIQKPKLYISIGMDF